MDNFTFSIKIKFQKKSLIKVKSKYNFRFYLLFDMTSSIVAKLKLTSGGSIVLLITLCLPPSILSFCFVKSNGGSVAAPSTPRMRCSTLFAFGARYIIVYFCLFNYYYFMFNCSLVVQLFGAGGLLDRTDSIIKKMEEFTIDTFLLWRRICG